MVIKDRPCTRRGILSAVNSLYDPLGMAAPFILSAKLLLQDLRSKDASNLSSPRISLHVRSIISVTPLRWPMAPYRIFALVDIQGPSFCSFLIGKSCLAPLKVTTIP